MSLGKAIITWDADDIVKGMSSSDNIQDGGFSPTTDAVNLTTTPGVMYQPASPTDKSTSLTGDMAVSVQNGTTLTAVDRIFLAIDAASSDGSYYYWNGSSLTLKRTDITNNYVFGRLAIICFANEFYATSNEAVIRWTADDSTFNVSFKNFADSAAPHPAITYRNFAYYGDGNLLLRQDAAGAAPTTILTLPTGEKITALGIDPGSGKLLISTSSGYNASDTIATQNKVYYYDGSSTESSKIVIVDELIQAFYNVGSTVFVTYAQNLGIWNGAGIQFLRHLSISLDNTFLAYQGHITNQGSTLYVIDDTQILAYGPVRQKGDNVFYYVYKNNVNSNTVTHIAFLGSGILGIGFKDEKFYTFDTTSVASTNTQTFFSNEYVFPDQEWVRRARVFYKSTVSNNASPGQLRLFDENGLITTIGSSGTILLTNTSGASSAVKEINNIDLKLNQLTFQLILSIVNPGIQRVIFYGDPANIT